MPVTSFSFAPTNKSAVSIQDFSTILAHRFTATSSGRRKPYSITCSLVRGGSALSTWIAGYPNDQDIKDTIPPSWDIVGDVNHVINTHADGALEFTGNTAGTQALFDRAEAIPAGSTILFTMDLEETLVGGAGQFEVNLYNDLNVEIHSTVVKMSPGDGTDTVYLAFPVEDALTSPRIIIENGTWGASSGSLFMENFIIQHYEPDTLQSTEFKVYLLDIESNEIIASSTTTQDLSELNLGPNQFEFILDDPRFRIENGKEYYILFTVISPDFTGWDTLPTGVGQVIPTGNLQRNLYAGMEEMSGITTETNTDFPTEVNSSPIRSTNSIVALSGTDIEIFSLNGDYINLKPSQDYKLRLQVKPTGLAGYPGGGGANVVDLTVDVMNRAGVLASSSTYNVALEDDGTIYTPTISFTTPSDDVGTRVRVVWDATGINPTYTPDITSEVSGIYLWEDDGVTADPAKYQLPDQMVNYAGAYLVTEDTLTETMSTRSAGAWVVDPTIGGVVTEVKAYDATTTQVLLNAAGDLFFNLDSIWPSNKVEQPAAMKSILTFIDQGLALSGQKVPLPVQLRQDDIPYSSDWLVTLISDHGINSLQENGVYIWATEDNAYGGRFLLHNGEIIPFIDPLGNGRVVTIDKDVGGGTITSGTTTKTSLGTFSFDLLRPAKVSVIWAITAVDTTTIADRLVNIRPALNGTPVPDGTGSQDTNDKFLKVANTTADANAYFIDILFDDLLPVGANSVEFSGTRGASGNSVLTFKNRLYTLFSANNNYQIKSTSMLEITHK